MKVCSSALPPFLVESTRRLLSIDVIVPRLVPVTALPCGFGKACFVAAALDCFCGFGLASPIPLTRQELLARWPGDPPRPETLWRTLARGWQLGLIQVSGDGTKVDALRYRLAGDGKASESAAAEAAAGQG